MARSQSKSKSESNEQRKLEAKIEAGAGEVGTAGAVRARSFSAAVYGLVQLVTSGKFDMGDGGGYDAEDGCSKAGGSREADEGHDMEAKVEVEKFFAPFSERYEPIVFEQGEKYELMQYNSNQHAEKKNTSAEIGRESLRENAFFGWNTLEEIDNGSEHELESFEKHTGTSKSPLAVPKSSNDNAISPTNILDSWVERLAASKRFSTQSYLTAYSEWEEWCDLNSLPGELDSDAGDSDEYDADDERDDGGKLIIGVRSEDGTNEVRGEEYEDVWLWVASQKDDTWSGACKSRSGSGRKRHM